MSGDGWEKLLAPLGGAAGGWVYVRFLWERLSFIPGTSSSAEFTGYAGTVAGLLLDQLIKRRIRAHGRQLAAAIMSLGLAAVVFVFYGVYVVWATKAGYVEGPAVYFQYAVLLLMALLWALAWASALRFLAAKAKQ